MREEERLYSFWERLKTGLAGSEIPSYTEFRDEVYEESVGKKEPKETGRLGKISGDDITR